jgi:hypothetical protein
VPEILVIVTDLKELRHNHIHMKRTFLLLFLIAGLTCIISAQENNRFHSVSIRWGPGYLARQDLIFSPFIHNDFSLLHTGLEYTRTADIYQHVLVRYSGYSQILKQPFEYMVYDEVKAAFPGTFTFVDLDYMVGKSIHPAGRFSLTLGGLFSSDIQALNYVYGRIGHFGYYASLGLGGFLKVDHRFSQKNMAGVSLQLPFISWLARSPYLVNDDAFIENTSSHSGVKTFLNFLADGKPATWNRLQCFDLYIYYSYTLNARLKLGAGYLFAFIHSSSPRNLLSCANTLNLSATFSF